VLSVDPSRGRISLSLKTQRPPVSSSEREERGGRGEAPSRALRPGAQMSKAEALANLEKLFKK